MYLSMSTLFSMSGDASQHSSEVLSPSSFEIADQKQTSGALGSDSSAAMQRLLKAVGEEIKSFLLFIIFFN